MQIASNQCSSRKFLDLPQRGTDWKTSFLSLGAVYLGADIVGKGVVKVVSPVSRFAYVLPAYVLSRFAHVLGHSKKYSCKK